VSKITFFVYHAYAGLQHTSRGVRRRRFLMLMVGALGSPARAPPKGPTINVFYVDGGRSRISNFDTS
jgi:hypothetical protein